MIILQVLKNLLLIIRQVASEGKVSVFYCSWVPQGESWIKQKSIKYRSHSTAAREQTTHLLYIPKRFITPAY